MGLYESFMDGVRTGEMKWRWIQYGLRKDMSIGVIDDAHPAMNWIITKEGFPMPCTCEACRKYEEEHDAKRSADRGSAGPDAAGPADEAVRVDVEEDQQVVRGLQGPAGNAGPASGDDLQQGVRAETEEEGPCCWDGSFGGDCGHADR